MILFVGLTGHLPSSIGNLTHFESLDFYGNDLAGPLPSTLGDLKSSTLTLIELGFNNFNGLIPASLTELCSTETTYCQLTGNNRLCGDGQRVIGSTCYPCPSKSNCAAFGACHNGFNPQDYFCSTCPGSSFNTAGSCVDCVGGWFGTFFPILLVTIIAIVIFVVYWVLRRRRLIKEHHLKHFNLSMDKQTRLKQFTTVLQVLSEASKFNNLPYPQWFLSFSLLGNFFTMPFQPQSACLHLELPSYANGVVIFFTVELLIKVLKRLHSIPFLGSRISFKTKERCQVLASILATVAIIPILRVSLGVPTLISTSFDRLASSSSDLDVYREVIFDGSAHLLAAIVIVTFMYFRIEVNSMKYSAERRNYMEDFEAYDKDEDSQISNFLPFLSSFCANYTPQSSFHESKATRRKIFCYLIPALTSLIELGSGCIYIIISSETNMEGIPLTISCMQTTLFLAAHLVYLRHLENRPYLSFRASKVYGDALNDTEVLITRVLCATPTLFTLLQAVSLQSDDDEALSATGQVFASFVLLGILWSMKRLVLGVTDSFKGFCASGQPDLNRKRSHSASDEKGVGDKIEKMMDTKDVIERWELERTLDRNLMAEAEKIRWFVTDQRHQPSILKIFCLVICTIIVSLFGTFGLFFLVLHAASRSWAPWLCFFGVLRGFVSVDTYAVRCLSGDDGDVIHFYLRGYFRSMSKKMPASFEEEAKQEGEEG
ncbi:hypothetical protein TL16_g03454 [Triparma laevis f. inornata]|uniref:Uncharacterized protein n=1 Tax=Triparma laevis f. inornata TaxID=1714386 RepID=A0A9W6ZYR3_9STRA|nr:hypothetical protein TL16_g03454 [Triparma laevis f. inornata]